MQAKILIQIPKLAKAARKRQIRQSGHVCRSNRETNADGAVCVCKIKIMRKKKLAVGVGAEKQTGGSNVSLMNRYDCI